MNLPGSGQTAHRFPHPRARSKGREEDLNLLGSGGVHRLQVNRNQQRQGGDLAGRAGFRERVAVASTQQLPASGLAGLAVHRADPQSLPELAQAAQNCGFGQLPSECLPRLSRGQGPFLLERLPQLEDQGRHLVARGLLRRMLPIGIRAQAQDIGQRRTRDQEIRLLPHCAEQIQPDQTARLNQPGDQRVGLDDSRRSGRGFRPAQRSFDKRRGGRRQLRPPGQIQRQRMLFEPQGRVIKSEEGILLLAPMRRSCCLELLCCQVDFRAFDASCSREKPV